MNESSAKLMVAVCDQVVFIMINGRGDFNLSLDLKKLFVELRQRGYRRFVLEICHCAMMDSTFLGMLSDSALKFRDAGHPQDFPLELVNPNPRIAETLENLGMSDLFKITYCPDSLAVAYQPMTETADKSKVEITRNCLEAHVTLMGLKAENVQKFKDVAQFLAEDLKRLESAEKK
jgi:anti-anti-sigma regulatory factor